MSFAPFPGPRRLLANEAESHVIRAALAVKIDGFAALVRARVGHSFGFERFLSIGHGVLFATLRKPP